MACLADAMSALKRYGYAHHIQRLMVLGLFAQLYGVHPYAFHQWHMAMYLDAHDWVSLPNALGMSQYGDGGIVGTKPYCASGAYIDRMSNACGQCRFRPKEATGERACPFTTLYWDFLDRHEADLKQNRRMQFQLRNLQRKSPEQRHAIRTQAEQMRRELSVRREHK
jgi:deoxyribodipyrimidine photolyase-related protein